ncbi:MAG: YHS domain-containing (seleno)protein [Cyclobacteriaceae bacterium]
MNTQTTSHVFNYRKVKACLLVTILATCTGVAVMAQADEASRRRNFNTNNAVALREFDPVSYFSNTKPLKGNSKFYANYKGITYYFANAENVEEFEKSPPKYEPAYGGWCAYTVALNGERVKVNPVSYKIIDGKLHMFYNFNSDNRLLKWNKDEKKFKAAAEKNWVARMH